MSFLSSSVSITRYRVEGTLAEPVLETVLNGLKNAVIREIDREPDQKSVGWTSFDAPFNPNFDGSNFVIGTHMVFSLRIDKKSLPSKVVNKQVNMAIRKRLAETDRENLSRNEKKEIKDDVIHRLYTQMPATPNVYDLIWDYEGNSLWFFSNLKEANEELETLFSKSFKLMLIRIFPFTAADSICGLSGAERDIVKDLSPTSFYEARHA